MINPEDDMVTVPRWVAELALIDHGKGCPRCSVGREDLCKETEFTDALREAVLWTPVWEVVPTCPGADGDKHCAYAEGHFFRHSYEVWEMAPAATPVVDPNQTKLF